MTVSVLTVATNGYLSHWSSLLNSIEANFFIEQEVVMHVFTDDISSAEAIKPETDRIRIMAHKVPNWAWPDATLLRFRAISDYATSIEGEITCWLDADMLVVRPTGAELNPKRWKSGLAFVRHPGFWRPTRKDVTSVWLRHPRVVPNDLLWWVRGRPPLGAWEDNPRSRAFVERSRQSAYVCGGAWFGETPSILQMADVLAQRTDEDLANGLVAKWHDESHLNWYLAHNEATLLGPSYCFEDSYPRLVCVNPRIKAVNKGFAVQSERATQR